MSRASRERAYHLQAAKAMKAAQSKQERHSREPSGLQATDFNLNTSAPTDVLVPLVVSPEFGYTIFQHPSAAEAKKTITAQFTSVGRGIENAHDQFAEAHADHYKNSERVIMRAVQHAPEAPEGKPRAAIILGGAPYRDVPLKKILEEGKFDRVDLVDMDEQGVRKAVEALPLDLQRKCRIILADITGGAVSKFCSELTEAVENANTIHSVAAKAAEIIEETKPMIPTFGEEEGSYVLAISHLVLSQLPVYPRDYMNALVERKFGRSHFVEANMPILNAFSSVEGLGSRLQQQHIRLLARAVRPSGIAYLGDTLMELFNVRNLKNGQIEAKIREDIGPMVAWRALAPVFQEEFGVVDPVSSTDEEDYWNYHEFPPEYSSTGIGKSYAVLAMEFTRPQLRRA